MLRISSTILTTPTRSLFAPRPYAVFSNLGALSQVAFKASIARDPDRPKRPQTAYLRFAEDYRSKHQPKGVEAKSSMGQIATAWKNISLVDKAPFENAYAKDKEVYQAAFQQYKDSGKLDAWKRDPAAPKRPLTPYFAWAMEKKKEPRFANLSVVEASKILKPEWAAAPTAEKEALKSRYEAEQEAYKKQKQVYDASSEKTSWMAKTGRLKVIQEAEAKKAKELEAKAKEKAKKDARKLRVAKKKEAEKLKAAKKKHAAAKKKEAEKLKAAKKKEQAAAKKAKEAEKKAALKAKEATRKAKELEKKAAEKEKAQKKKVAAQKAKAAEKTKKPAIGGKKVKA